MSWSNNLVTIPSGEGYVTHHYCQDDLNLGYVRGVGGRVQPSAHACEVCGEPAVFTGTFPIVKDVDESDTIQYLDAPTRILYVLQVEDLQEVYDSMEGEDAWAKLDRQSQQELIDAAVLRLDFDWAEQLEEVIADHQGVVTDDEEDDDGHSS